MALILWVGAFAGGIFAIKAVFPSPDDQMAIEMQFSPEKLNDFSTAAGGRKR